jgi:hypothetical protein
MSIENHLNLGKQEGSNRPQDFEAAWELLRQDPWLKDDEVAQKVLENGGVTEAGFEVDIGNYLAARSARLEGNEEKLAAIGMKDPKAVEAAMIVHSEPPEIENRRDLGGAY